MIDYIFKVGGKATDLDGPGKIKYTKGQSNKRADIEARIGSRHFLIDVQVVHPAASSYVTKDIEPLWSARFAEKAKKN